MSMITDNETLSMATMPGPEHDLGLFIDRLLFDIQDGYRKEHQDNWSKEDQLRAEGVRATCHTLEEFLKEYRDHEVNNG